LSVGVPVIGVNHLRGHLRSASLERNEITYPALLLLVSGGHTLLAHMNSPFEISVCGSTRDDSVGEAYDKVGRMLGCGFPAGAAVDKMASRGDAKYRFPRPLIADGLDFSFSGLKSSVARFLSQHPDASRDDVAASFVDACLDVLITKCERALTLHRAKSLVVVGGVAASPQLRAYTGALCERLGIRLCLPPLKWSTDNAAMIAYAAFDYIDTGNLIKAEAQARLPLTDW
jgi:N6-L-threonylcarbamoyladenine synthase